jgi:pteridine reductase
MKSSKRPVALVTGSSSFLGRTICLKLANKGYDLILHYYVSGRRTKRLGREIARLGAKVYLIKLDLSDLQSIPLIMDKVIHQTKRLDLLVNNASIFEPTDPNNKDFRSWLEIFSVNLHAPYVLGLWAYPWLKRNRGCIINLTDIYGESQGLEGHTAYSVSKAGLIHLTKILAREWGPDIRVNAVSPGAIRVPDDVRNFDLKKLIQKSALKRKGTQKEIADAVHFMVSNKFIDGQVLRVDGGSEIKGFNKGLIR